MPGDDIHQPHDKLFKAGFSDPENAAAFFKAELPEEVVRLIAWQELRLEPGSFIDSHLRLSESDLLFSAPLAGRRGLLYVLFEHQTSRDPLLALRLLRYMVRIWEGLLKEGPELRGLPVILPVVLAQNVEVVAGGAAVFRLAGPSGGAGWSVCAVHSRLCVPADPISRDSF